MKRSETQLREDALAIWHAGLDAVRSERLVRENLQVEGSSLIIAGEAVHLPDVERIVVVGGGKAGSGMAAAVEEVLGEGLLREKQVTGWLNVPADCVRPLSSIHLHAARPPGVNEPTAEGVAGCEQMLKLVSSLGPGDVCLCLISGGGSALMPAPAEGVTLEDKLALTRHLSHSGANIQELNTVRKQLSRIKGGRLAQQCRADRMFTLIISDVIGDPLDVIASGPTVPDTATAADAMEVLDRFGVVESNIAPTAVDYLRQACRQQAAPAGATSCQVTNTVIGNIAVAVDAAGIEAERRGYAHAMQAATQLEGAAEDVGRHLALMALRMRHQSGPDCLITGGEPIVSLCPPDIRGKGGRNQQLVLAALEHLIQESGIRPDQAEPVDGIFLLSGGTDGEDGPTTAAGAWIGPETLARLDPARSTSETVADHLARNDAWHFFEKTDGLLITGPTHTNVCDVRVVVVDRMETSERKAGE